MTYQLDIIRKRVPIARTNDLKSGRRDPLWDVRFGGGAPPRGLLSNFRPLGL
jgi:hypothetical protein